MKYREMVPPQTNYMWTLLHSCSAPDLKMNWRCIDQEDESDSKRAWIQHHLCLTHTPDLSPSTPRCFNRRASLEYRSIHPTFSYPFHLHFYSEQSVTWKQDLDSRDWEATAASARRNQKLLNDRKPSLHRSLKLAVRETVADAFRVVQAVSFLCICLHHTTPLSSHFHFSHACPVLLFCLN